ncbi:polysaccharide deacetylase family protein [Aurantimonas sp. Leaf443]|uniref:polysaccharide deacetylase family protein n=1 Tax=Aurantimonas sp. Leaf443 TaxID=1736378 RepID=UPI0006F440D9|nr:polysaccharide deacetylase family protein [Aurantimonas sp. Leaf443]KQT86122.1 hypothetical protein ASG48_05965 [Aurantimonas sp. Leaf443]
MQDADDLFRELDRWSALGRRTPVWWRDDDAVAPSPKLDDLLALRGAGALPLALAVIPAGTGPALAERLARPDAQEGVTVLQHGFAHRNHAAPGERAVECGGARETAAVLAEFAQGRERLAELFGARFLPAMVPPWNRIEPRIAAALRQSGLEAVSVFGPREAPHSGAVPVVNAHLDVLTWKGGARFAGRAKLIRLLCERLAERRLGAVDGSEPFGLLTHHLDHDGETNDFLAELLPVLAAHPAIEWRKARDIFGLPV